jgi:protein-tyrosine phosphatase
VYLLDKAPPAVPWESRWVQWPDFRLPRDRAAARRALLEAWRRLDTDRVEVACGGGVGRTGTALACLVALDARSSVDAVRYVRDHYDRRAVETPGQRRYVAAFAPVPHED